MFPYLVLNLLNHCICFGKDTPICKQNSNFSPSVSFADLLEVQINCLMYATEVFNNQPLKAGLLIDSKYFSKQNCAFYLRLHGKQ